MDKTATGKCGLNMPIFRCVNCETPLAAGYEFTAVKAECPQCGAEGAPHVVKLVVIHFAAPKFTKKGFRLKGRGEYFAACNKAIKPQPNMPPSAVVRMTGQASVVNCPECRKTKAWIAEYASQGNPECPEDADIPVHEYVQEDRVGKASFPTAEDAGAVVK